MALERSLRLRYIYNDEIETTTFSNVNPNAGYQVMDTAMKQLNALTNNTYVDTYVVDTQSLNELMVGDNNG